MPELNKNNFWDFLDEQEDQGQFVILPVSDLKRVFEEVVDDSFEDSLQDYKDECYERKQELIEWIEHTWKYLSQEDSICSTNEFLSKTIQQFLDD